MRSGARVDIEFVKGWLAAGAFAISIITAAWSWANSPGRKVLAKIGELATTLGHHEKATLDELKKHDRRIQAVESEIRHLPTSEEFQTLQISVTKIEGELGRVDETLGSVKHTVERIDDYLRSNR